MSFFSGPHRLSWVGGWNQSSCVFWGAMGFRFMMILISESLLPNKSTVAIERPGGWNVVCANHFLNSELLGKPMEIPPGFTASPVS